MSDRIRRGTWIALAVLGALVLAQAGAAMQSTGYRLEWLVPLTGNGGGPMQSTGYTLDLTVGQSVVGAASSANYQVGLGYWYGAQAAPVIYLPVVAR